ncbi:Uncharacterised protein [Mycobacteroides abscessus subsp. abscessus]|nr:Uncharacterised protein [Mycobacteroides abscessus subsp. abscessus]
MRSATAWSVTGCTPATNTALTPAISAPYLDGCSVLRCASRASNSSSVEPGVAAARSASSAGEVGSGAGGRSRWR